jgi:hypothetical protein
MLGETPRRNQLTSREGGGGWGQVTYVCRDKHGEGNILATSRCHSAKNSPTSHPGKFMSHTLTNALAHTETKGKEKDEVNGGKGVWQNTGIEARAPGRAHEGGGGESRGNT